MKELGLAVMLLILFVEEPGWNVPVTGYRNWLRFSQSVQAIWNIALK